MSFSEHMKKHHINKQSHIEITVGMPGGSKIHYKLPNTRQAQNELRAFLQNYETEKTITPWEQATPWEVIAKERIEKYSKAGLVLRGARYREGLSQKELAQKCNISQDNLSRMENGKRVIGERVAKRLAKALKINYLLLLEA